MLLGLYTFSCPHTNLHDSTDTRYTYDNPLATSPRGRGPHTNTSTHLWTFMQVSFSVQSQKTTCMKVQNPKSRLTVHPKFDSHGAEPATTHSALTLAASRAHWYGSKECYKYGNGTEPAEPQQGPLQEFMAVKNAIKTSPGSACRKATVCPASLCTQSHRKSVAARLGRCPYISRHAH